VWPVHSDALCDGFVAVGAHAKSITVEVQGSNAILKGKVRSRAEKHEAEQVF
jgi:osmotically-inducible protein OsmY